MEIYQFCQRVYIRKQSSILIQRCKNEAWFPRCSTLRSNTLRIDIYEWCLKLIVIIFVFIFFRRSIWNELFYIIRFKELKKEVGPKWCWINSHWYANILFKNHTSCRVKKHLLIDKSLFSEVSSSSSLRSPIDICFEKPMHFLTLDLKTKLITSESTFRRSLCGMVVDKMLNSKAEIDLAFFLTLILFSLVAIGKEFCTTQNFSQPEWKKLWVWKLSTVLRIILKSLDVVSESGFVLQ